MRALSLNMICVFSLFPFIGEREFTARLPYGAAALSQMAAPARESEGAKLLRQVITRSNGFLQAVL